MELEALLPPFSGSSRSDGCPHTDDMVIMMLAKAAAFSLRTGRSPAASSTPRNSNAREGWYSGGCEPLMRALSYTTRESSYGSSCHRSVTRRRSLLNLERFSAATTGTSPPRSKRTKT